MTKLTSIEINSYKHITIQQIGLHLYTHKKIHFQELKSGHAIGESLFIMHRIYTTQIKNQIKLYETNSTK